MKSGLSLGWSRGFQGCDYFYLLFRFLIRSFFEGCYFVFSGEESWLSPDGLDRGVLSLVDERFMDSFEIESRELFDKSRMSRIEVLVVVKSVVQSAVGSCSAMSSCRCRGKHFDVFSFRIWFWMYFKYCVLSPNVGPGLES